MHFIAYYSSTLQLVVDLCAKMYYAAFSTNPFITLLASVVETQSSIILLIFYKNLSKKNIETLAMQFLSKELISNVLLFIFVVLFFSIIDLFQIHKTHILHLILEMKMIC